MQDHKVSHLEGDCKTTSGMGGIVWHTQGVGGQDSTANGGTGVLGLEGVMASHGKTVGTAKDGTASAREVRQARIDFQKSLQVYIWSQVQQAGADVEAIMMSGQFKK